MINNSKFQDPSIFSSTNFQIKKLVCVVRKKI